MISPMERGDIEVLLESRSKRYQVCSLEILNKEQLETSGSSVASYRESSCVGVGREHCRDLQSVCAAEPCDEFEFAGGHIEKL